MAIRYLPSTIFTAPTVFLLFQRQDRRWLHATRLFRITNYFSALTSDDLAVTSAILQKAARLKWLSGHSVLRASGSATGWPAGRRIIITKVIITQSNSVKRTVKPKSKSATTADLSTSAMRYDDLWDRLMQRHTFL